MIPVQIGELRKGDRFRFSSRSRVVYTITGIQTAPDDDDLVCVETAQRAPMTMPFITEVQGVQMHRVAEVPCLNGRHEGGLLPVIVDIAVNRVPTGILCGDCDEMTTAEVMAEVKKRKETET